MDIDIQALAIEFGEVSGQLAAALILGGLLGAEREAKGQWAGLRTHMMVALGAALFTIVGVKAVGDNREISRVIQGIAAGIGFLGAGTILKLAGNREVKGLTTAASIWLAAALGTAIGLKFYVVALSATMCSLIVLALLRPLEKKWIEPPSKKKHADEATPDEET
jgi:putative Mg2+ transporter-C (MgtC) family protein